MNLRKNNGFAGTDISIAIIIILIFIPTIFGIVYNIQKTNGSVKRKSNAVNILTNILEIARSENYNDLTLQDSEFITHLNNNYTESSYTNSELEEEGFQYKYYQKIGKNGEHYQVQIGIKNYYPEDVTEQDLIKILKVQVIYPVGKKINTVNISMAFNKS